MRRLCKLIVGERRLAGMAARGAWRCRPIPPHIFNPIKSSKLFSFFPPPLTWTCFYLFFFAVPVSFNLFGIFVSILFLFFFVLQDFIFEDTLSGQANMSEKDYIHAVNVMFGNLRQKFGLCQPLEPSSDKVGKPGRKMKTDKGEGSDKVMKKSLCTDQTQVTDFLKIMRWKVLYFKTWLVGLPLSC